MTQAKLGNGNPQKTKNKIRELIAKIDVCLRFGFWGKQFSDPSTSTMIVQPARSPTEKKRRIRKLAWQSLYSIELYCGEKNCRQHEPLLTALWCSQQLQPLYIKYHSGGIRLFLFMYKQHRLFMATHFTSPSCCYCLLVYLNMIPSAILLYYYYYYW